MPQDLEGSQFVGGGGEGFHYYLHCPNFVSIFSNNFLHIQIFTKTLMFQSET